MLQIVFVCRGNTCRSPMAEAYARYKAGLLGRADFAFLSAGVAPSALGTGRTDHASTTLIAAGIPCPAHETQGLTDALMADVDLVLVMDTSVDRDVRGTFPAHASKVRPLMSYAAHLGGEVADPWGGTAADYARAFILIRAAVDGVIAHVQRKG